MGSGIVRYNLKKGTMRLWVVASICWVIFLAGMFVTEGPSWPERPELLAIEKSMCGGLPVDEHGSPPKKTSIDDLILFTPEELEAMPCEEREARIVETKGDANRRRLSSYEEERFNFIGDILFALAAMVVVPLFVLLLGHIIAWVVRGFMGDRQA